MVPLDRFDRLVRLDRPDRPDLLDRLDLPDRPLLPRAVLQTVSGDLIRLLARCRTLVLQSFPLRCRPVLRPLLPVR